MDPNVLKESEIDRSRERDRERKMCVCVWRIGIFFVAMDFEDEVFWFYFGLWGGVLCFWGKLRVFFFGWVASMGLEERRAGVVEFLSFWQNLSFLCLGASSVDVGRIFELLVLRCFFSGRGGEVLSFLSFSQIWGFFCCWGDSSLSVGRSFELLTKFELFSVEVLLQWAWRGGVWSFEFWTKFELFVLSCFNFVWGSFQLFENFELFVFRCFFSGCGEKVLSFRQNLSFLYWVASTGVGEFSVFDKFELFVFRCFFSGCGEKVWAFDKIWAFCTESLQ